MSEGQDIVEAVKGIKGTSIANIEPNREHKEGKKPVIPGISNLFEFQWPVEGEFSGFVRGRALPNFGKWNDFSPESIHKSMKGGEQHQPNPQISTHTDPQAQWIIPMPSTGLNWQFFLNKTINKKKFFFIFHVKMHCEFISGMVYQNPWVYT